MTTSLSRSGDDMRQQQAGVLNAETTRSEDTRLKPRAGCPVPAPCPSLETR